MADETQFEGNIAPELPGVGAGSIKPKQPNIDKSSVLPPPMPAPKPNE